MPEKERATQVVKNIRRATRRHFSAEDKIRIELEGLRVAGTEGYNPVAYAPYVVAAGIGNLLKLDFPNLLSAHADARRGRSWLYW